MTSLEITTRPTPGTIRDRYLPTLVDESTAICTGESVPAALQRITTHHFTIAIDALADPTGDIGDAVDDADEALQLVSAAVRLVRSAVGTDVARAELRELDAARRFLAGFGEGRDEILSLDAIRGRYEAALRSDALSDLRDQLLHRHQLRRLARVAGAHDAGELAHHLQRLRRARSRFAAWPIDEPIHGRVPVPDSFAAFEDGIQRSYRKGRSHAARDHIAPKWQRHATDLRHQLQLLVGGWPDMMVAMVATAQDLGTVLAEHRRFGMLRTSLESPAGHPPTDVVISETAASVVKALCDHERNELESVAAALARRLYGESPDAFVARCGGYWASRR